MRETARSEFGSRLRQARNHAGLTQQALAKKVGMPLSTLAEAETKGQGSTYTSQIAAACAVSPEWLATGDGEMQSEWTWPFDLLKPDQITLLDKDELKLVENYALHLIDLKKQHRRLQTEVQTAPTESEGSGLEVEFTTKRKTRSGTSDRTRKATG